MNSQSLIGAVTLKSGKIYPGLFPYGDVEAGRTRLKIAQL